MGGHVEVVDDLEAVYVERYADFVRVATAITGSESNGLAERSSRTAACRTLRPEPTSSTFAVGSPRFPSDSAWRSSCATTATATTAPSPRRATSRWERSRRR